MTRSDWASELRRINQAFAEQEARLTEALSHALQQSQVSDSALREARTQLAAAEQAQDELLARTESQAQALQAQALGEQAAQATLAQARHELQQALDQAAGLQVAQQQAADQAQHAVQALQQQAEQAAARWQAEQQQFEAAAERAHAQAIAQAVAQERARAESAGRALTATAAAAAAAAAQRESALQAALVQAQAQRRTDAQSHHQASTEAERRHAASLQHLRAELQQQHDAQLQQDLQAQATRAQERIDALLGQLAALRQDLQHRSDAAAAAERQHAAKAQHLQDALQVGTERAQARLDLLQAQVLASRKAQLSSQAESDARESALREQLMHTVAAGLERVQAHWAALEHQAVEHRGLAAQREKALHDQHAAAQVRLQQATLDLQVLRDRAETVQAELRAAQHARARSEEAARCREQALRNEFKTSLAAVQEQAVDLQARLAQQAAQGEQRASADASALAAAQDRIAELDGAHGELAALKATRERLAADLSHTQARLLEQTAHAQDAGWALEQAREHAARQLAEFTQLLRRPWWQRLLQPTPPVVATLMAAMPPAAAPPASGIGNLMSTKTPEPIRHVNQLLALHGAEFLTAAYREVLGREPDAPGAAAYLQRLQTEHDKAAVLCEFVTCPEGQERRQTLPGLAELVAIRDPGRGRLRRFLNKFARLDQAAVRIEWLVGAMHQQMSAELSAGQAKTEQVLAALQDLSRRVDHQVAECSLRIDTAVDRMSQQVTQLSRLQESTAAQLALYEEHRNLDSDMQARRLSRDREFLLQQQAALVSDAHRGTPAAGAAVAPLLTVNDLLLLAQNARSPGVT